MKQPTTSLSHMGSSIIHATLTNTVGYASASIAGASCAAAVGSYVTIMGVAAVGSAALYLPTMGLRYSLDYLGLMNSLVSEAINLAYFAGSAALGALILGVAIKPVIMCAVVGIIMYACLAAFFPNKEPAAAPIHDDRKKVSGISLAHVFDDLPQDTDSNRNRLFTKPCRKASNVAVVEEVIDESPCYSS